MKISDPMALPLLRIAFVLRSRMRSTPDSASSLPPVDSSTLSPLATATFITRTLSLPSSMTSLALVGLKLTSGMRLGPPQYRCNAPIEARPHGALCEGHDRLHARLRL